jgi:hypothetical protein
MESKMTNSKSYRTAVGKVRITLLFSVLSLLGGLLEAKEYDNILLYKNCGTWKKNIFAIEAGKPDAGRIAWDGRTLEFVPRNGVYDLKDTYCFGFAIRAPEKMKNQLMTVKFIYDEGKPVVWNFRTPEHTGWKGINAKILAGSWPNIRPGKLKAIEFSTKIPGFQAVLDDIRLVPDGLNYQFEEAWVPEVINGCFFPEYTLDQQRKETLTDPNFKAKMSEIERLRQTKLKITLKQQHTTVQNLQGIPYMERIHPDGSIEGLSYEDVKRIHKQRRFWHDVNETFMMQHCGFYTQLLLYWEWGKVPRTEENRKKLFRSMIRTLTAESNRRQECMRHVVPAFVLSGTAVRIYRVFFDEMEAVEKGTNHDPDTIRLNRLLKEAASWCYFHTFYNTVAPVLTLESFSGASDWTGGNFSYRPTFLSALVCRNPKMLDVISGVAKGSLYPPTSYNTVRTSFWPDAMTADGSAWGHGNQNYPFGYPLSGVLGIGELIGNLSGTNWGLKTDGPAFNAVCDYMEALLWHGTGWTKNENKNVPMDQLLQRDIPVACGRIGQLYNEGKGYGNFREAYRTANIFLNLMPEGSIQRQRLQYCSDVMSGKIQQLPVGTRYFWNNDLLICREKDSLVAVSMLSSRVIGIEAAGSNSKLTDFWSDGAAWIMKHFDSYRIARGFMKPCAIPGVTSRQWEFTHQGKDWRSYTGKYNFAGGVTDDNYAACGYHMERQKHPASHDPNFYQLTARKAYFWLNGKLICIGAGISDNADRGVPVATTIDQTLWRGPATLGSGTVKKPGESFRMDSQLLWHDGVGYWVMNGKGILSGETRKARWLDFDLNNQESKNLPQSAPMLMFQIDHGKNVKNGSYAYAVDFHCTSFPDLQKNAKSSPFEIIAASNDIQAVREKRSGTLAAVFYKPGEIGGLKINVPAVVLLRRTPDGDIRVTINDPEQNPKLGSVMLGWENQFYEIKLPTGVSCGKQVTVNLSNLKPLSKK